MTLCAQKTAYETEHAAHLALVKWQEGVARRGGGRAPTRCYACPHCQSWHLTSQPRTERLKVDGLPVFERWSHPRDAAPKRVGDEIQMNPFAANELRTSDPHELLDLMLHSIKLRAGWRMRKALERIERMHNG